MKIVLLTDIHFGLKNNSEEHNQQCLNFLQFVQEWTDEHLVEDFNTIFCGDWFHNRNNINVKTLNYAKEGMIALSNIGAHQYMLLGNHDLYGLNRRDLTSVIIPEEASGIEVIAEPVMIENDLLISPWLINDETLTDIISENNPQYVFCHAEIPTFKFNKMITMEGEYIPFDYQGPKRIITGHFHKRQEKNNITYIGACFSHDFSDENDWHNKGFAVLDTETNDLQYIEWKEAPKYLVKNISEIDKFDVECNTHLKLVNDLNLDNKKLDKIKTKLSENDNIVEILVYPCQTNISEVNVEEKKEIYASIDLMIGDLLSKCDIENINNKKMLDIYNSL